MHTNSLKSVPAARYIGNANFIRNMQINAFRLKRWRSLDSRTHAAVSALAFGGLDTLTEYMLYQTCGPLP